MRLGTQLRLLVAILLLAAYIPSCNFMSAEQKPPIVLEWDLSKSQTLQDVGWSASPTAPFFAREGNFLLKIKLPSNKVFDERVTFVDCYRRGDVISTLVIHLPIKDTDEVYQDARRLAQYWQLDMKALEAWYARRKQSIDELDKRFETMRNDLWPAPVLAIKNSHDREKPWYVSFEISLISPDDLK